MRGRWVGTEHRRFEVERPPADGELGAASTHGGVHLDLARLLAASSGFVRSGTTTSTSRSPATGRTRIE
jgi:hypothetical protein